ncbi:MAG: transcription-repair coupling factor, partial [Nautiliaceae bacterium]
MQARAYEFLRDKKSSIITSNLKEALSIGEVYRYLDVKAVVFPDFRAVLGDDLRSFRKEIFELNNALYKYYNDGYYFVSPYSTIMKKLPVKRYYKSFKLEFGDSVDLEKLKRKLFLWGYERVDIVSEKGEVSFRGDIVDIWPINFDKPVRISLFDTEIESIRAFDEVTQKSIEEIEDVLIIPAIAALDEEEYEKIREEILKSPFSTFYKDFYSLGFWYLNREFLEDFVLIKDLTKEIEEYREFYKEFNEAILKAEIISNKECKDVEWSIKKDKIYINNKPWDEKKTLEIVAKNDVLLRKKGLDEFVRLKA